MSLGGDSDTLAAITGSIAEAFYGVPEELRQECRKRLTPKLAAILRVADALERTHRETPRVLEFRREADRFVILLRDMEDLTMERLALKDKGNLFADVFGLVPELRELRTELPGSAAG